MQFYFVSYFRISLSLCLWKSQVTCSSMTSWSKIKSLLRKYFYDLRSVANPCEDKIAFKYDVLHHLLFDIWPPKVCSCCALCLTFYGVLCVQCPDYPWCWKITLIVPVRLCCSFSVFLLVNSVFLQSVLHFAGTFAQLCCHCLEVDMCVLFILL